MNAKYELDDTPIDETCGCPVCRRYSKAYIRHLLKAKGWRGESRCSFAFFHDISYHSGIFGKRD